jgi:hypothetical protein
MSQLPPRASWKSGAGAAELQVATWQGSPIDSGEDHNSPDSTGVLGIAVDCAGYKYLHLGGVPVPG